MTDDEKIKLLRAYISESESAVFFGGAGVSTESGIPDFRSESGLYSARQTFNRQPEYLLSHTCYEREPELFFSYYKQYLIAKNAEPNAAHYALAELERRGKLSAVITQNIDGLHQAAGSKTVYELHGSNWRQYCSRCNEKHTLDYVLETDGVPICKKCGGIVRPDVVLYEESLDDDVISASIRAIAGADLLIIGGTSLTVYPAAGLIQYFRGKNIVLINKSETAADNSAALIIRDSIGKILSAATDCALYTAQENPGAAEKV